jgi:NitT/TauT family transport system substrate-binding protein
MNRTIQSLAVALAFCAQGFAASAQEEKVTFATASGSVAYVTYYATEEMGYFKDVGLETEMILTGSGSKAMAAAVGGNVDVVMPSAGELLKARQKEIDLVMFGAVATQLSTSIVFSKDWAASHNITDNSSLDEKIAALKGIRLAISGPGSLTDAVVKYFARRGGFDPDRDMTLVAIQNQSSAMMISMEQGRVDGFVIAPPDTNIAAHDQGALIAFNLAAGKIPELAGYFHIGLASTEEFAKSAKAEKIAKAFQMTLDAINDPARTNEVRDRIHAKYYPKVDAGVFAEVWKNVAIAVPDTLQMTDASFDKVLVLEKVLDPENDLSAVQGSYTNEVADKVAQR